jgi:hypothetical protein
MNKQISDKFFNLSFLSIVLVVVLHSQNITNRINNFHPAIWNYNIQYFIYNGIARIAVPVFFLTSGFFFFDNKKMESIDFIIKIKKRVRTVLVPYLIVSFLVIAFIWILQIIPFSAKYFNNEPVRDFTIMKFLKTWLLTPIAYQLWFLQYLMIAVIFSPIIYLFLFYTKTLGIIVLGILWLYFSVETPYFSSLYFFILGGYLKFFKYEKINNNEYSFNNSLMFFLWMLLLIIFLFLNDNGRLCFIIRNLSILPGILFVWSVLDKNSITLFFKRKTLREGVLFAFFIYLFHEPILTILTKISFSFFGKTDAVSILTFFLSAIITILICIITGALLKKKASTFYYILTGNR